MRTARFLILFVLSLSFTASSRAQILYDGNQTLPPFGSYHGGDFDLVSLQNGNLHMHIPLLSVPQRGERLAFSYIYDTPSFQLVWIPQPTQQDPNAGTYRTDAVQGGGGWRLNSPFNWGVGSPVSVNSCNPAFNPNAFQNYTVTDPEGAKHPIPLVIGQGGLPTCGEVHSGPAMDGSGIFVSYVPSSPVTVPPCCFVITQKDGATLGATRKDSNGNIMSASIDRLSTADTLNRNILAVTLVTGPPAYTVWITTDSNGGALTFRVDYASPSV